MCVIINNMNSPTINKKDEKELSSRQQNILEDIESEITGLERFLKERTLEELSKEEEDLDLAYGLIDKINSLMQSAIGNDLTDEPAVKRWIDVRKVLGDWDALRRPRKGLEAGVKHPYTTEEFILITQVPALYKRLCSIEAVRRHLINTSKIKRIKKQTFHEKLERLGIIEALKEIDENKKADLDSQQAFKQKLRK